MESSTGQWLSITTLCSLCSSFLSENRAVSFAFEIARKIGLPEEILNEASGKAGVKNIDYDRHLKDIAAIKDTGNKKNEHPSA